MTREERDWRVRLADYIDAEGHLGIWVYPDRLPRPQWMAVVGITNNYKPILDEFQRRFGGFMTHHKSTPLSRHERWDLRWAGTRKSRTVLTIAYPFLVIKRARCEAFFRALEDPVFRPDRGCAVGRLPRVTRETWERRQNLANSVNNSGWESIPSEALEGVNAG